MTEAHQLTTAPPRIQIMDTLTPNAAGNDITKQASSSVGSPSHDTQSGARSETMRGEPRKGEENDDDG